MLARIHLSLCQAAGADEPPASHRPPAGTMNAGIDAAWPTPTS